MAKKSKRISVKNSDTKLVAKNIAPISSDVVSVSYHVNHRLIAWVGTKKTIAKSDTVAPIGLQIHQSGKLQTTKPRFGIFSVAEKCGVYQHALFTQNESDEMHLSDNRLRLVLGAEFPFRYLTQRDFGTKTRTGDGNLGFKFEHVNSTRSNMNHGTGDHGQYKREIGDYFRRFDIDGNPETDKSGNVIKSKKSE